VHTILTLELATRARDDGDEGAQALLAEALAHARRANDELREPSQGILSPRGSPRDGLRVDVETLVSRVPLPVATGVSVGRLPPVVEATASLIVAEVQSNVVKHARAERADVSMHVEDGTLHTRCAMTASAAPGRTEPA
jgi:signal transduction histidine kinase